MMLRTIKNLFRLKIAEIPYVIFNGRKIELFVHKYNCGFPPFRMTERSLELALLDLWLDSGIYKDFVEIGAVSPYYWPGRILEIVDPGDTHPRVTSKHKFLEGNFKGRNVVSISTFEHIGTDDYSLDIKNMELEYSFLKLIEEAQSFFLSVPTGYNLNCDQYIRKNLANIKCLDFYCFKRGLGKSIWKQCDLKDVFLPYGMKFNQYKWANGIIFICKGSVFNF